MALTTAHIRIVSAYIGSSASLPANAVDEINRKFLAVGLAPVYTATRLRRALYNYAYRRRHARLKDGTRRPPTATEINAMCTWMDAENVDVADGDSGCMGAWPEIDNGDSGCMGAWPEIDNEEAAREAAMRGMVPFSLLDANNIDDFYYTLALEHGPNLGG